MNTTQNSSVARGARRLPSFILAALLAASFLAVSIPALAGGNSVVLQRGGGTSEVVMAGGFAYVGQGATVVTVALPEVNPPKVVHISDALPGVVRGLAVKDDILFVSWHGLRSQITLFSLADPAHPEPLGDYSYDADDEPRQLELVDTTLFVADAVLGLVPIDVSDPTTPIAHPPTGEPCELLSFMDAGHMVAGLSSEGQAPNPPILRMDVYDVSEPAMPVLESTIFEPILYWDMAAGSDFIVPGPRPRSIWSVADPTDPMELPFDVGMPASGQLVVDDRLFLSTPFPGIRTWDFTDPWNPVEGPSVELPISLGDSTATAANAARDRAIFAYEESRLVTLDIADPEAPALRHIVRMPTLGSVWDVSQLGPNLFTLGRSGIQRLNRNLLVLETYEDLSEDINRLLAKRDPLLMVGLPEGIQIIDFTDSASPQVLSSLPLDSPTAATWSEDGLAWVATRTFSNPPSQEGVLATVDLSDPANPEIVSTLQISGGADLARQGSYLYLADLSGSLRIYDVTQTTPLPVGQYTGCENVRNVGVVNSLAVAHCGYGRFDVVDVSDPQNPSRLATHLVPSLITATEAPLLFTRETGAHRFFVGVPSGIDVIDVSDPKRPVRTDQIEVAGRQIYEMEPTKGGFWVATSGGGVARVRLDEGGPVGGSLMSAGRK